MLSCSSLQRTDRWITPLRGPFQAASIGAELPGVQLFGFFQQLMPMVE
ncbi:hypothetical protein ARTSIC4J27_2169 [Pseudarthrobacter siccitolerans]|uniref:Uncharacterized protein n=1 Tax=Pseudarthrobacter siccitolerans TaxID=861266 RepID=A0A024H361_9MICC|nr:hypothetical protein ARTSIC4J27_2169 [Pseudarthrobacter siccitolerans]